MPSKTGIWNQEEADANHIFSYRIAQWLGVFFEKNKNLFDFGCGKGAYCKYFEDIGFRNTLGIDGEIYNNIENKAFAKADLSLPFDLNIKGNVLCLEVGEHIPEESLDVFIDNLTTHCSGWLILSWAVPGQDGIGHVSCRANQWVIDQMNSRGFIYAPIETNEIRKVPEGFVNYFKETLLVFKKN